MIEQPWKLLRDFAALQYMVGAITKSQYENIASELEEPINHQKVIGGLSEEVDKEINRVTVIK